MNYFPKWTPIYHNNNYDKISTQTSVVIGNNKRAEFDPQTSVCLAYMYNVHPQLSSTLIFIVATLEKFYLIRIHCQMLLNHTCMHQERHTLTSCNG